MKKYNSVATVSFLVFHDDKERATEREIWAGLFRRLRVIVEDRCLDEAVGLEDTIEEEDYIRDYPSGGDIR